MVWWWWCNVVSESVLTPRKPRLEADTEAFLRLHRKQYLGISCYTDMTVSNHCRTQDIVITGAGASPSGPEHTSKEILYFDE